MIDYKDPIAVKTKRLTERDEYGNADIIGVDSADLQMNLEFEQLNLVTCALNQLAHYEESELELEAENAALRADNAMLIKANKEIEYLTNNRREEIRNLINGPMACNSEQADYLVSKGIADWKNVFSDPHPGAALLKETEQLKQRIERYEQPNLKCGKGHENNLPLSLWDCPMCTEELRQDLEQYKRALGLAGECLADANEVCCPADYITHDGALCAEKYPCSGKQKECWGEYFLAQTKAGDPLEPIG